MSLDDIINIQITVTDKAPTRPNFGIPLIASFHTAWGDRVREYADPDDMLDDGFVAGDAAYKLATSIKSQNPAVRRFKIGRLEDATYTHTFTLTPTNTTAGLTYSGTINGEAFSFDVQSGDTVGDICDDLVTAINGLTGVTCTDNATYVTVTADNSETIISVASMTEHLRLEDTTAVVSSDLAADLAAIQDEDSNWYGLVLEINSASAILAAAAWTETKTKIFIPMSSDGEILDAGVTDCVASQLKALSYTRTAGIWHRSLGGTEWANAAFLAINLAPDPGSYTAAFKSLAGISADSIRAGGLSALNTKYFTRYTEVGGVNVTFEGRTPSGRFIDVTRFVDWLQSEIQNDVYGLLINNPKIPYTNAGISTIKGAVEGALIRGRNAGGIADDTPIIVTAPDITETTASDRANRILRDVNFSARLSGALHGIVIRGTLSV